MESKEDLQRQTVAQLREKLKQRHLLTTGTKIELVERLYESFQEEENLLVGGGANEEDLDDLLGTNLSDQALTSNEEALLLGLPSKTTSVTKSSIAEAPKTVSPKKAAAPKPVISNDSSTKIAIPKEPTNIETVGSDDVKSEETTQSKPVRQPIRSTVITDTSEDKKKQRAARFGGSVVQASNENTEKGLPPTSGAEKHPISLNSSTKLLERVKRFGLPVKGSNDESNGVTTAKRAHIQTVDESDDAKKRRMQRFAK